MQIVHFGPIECLGPDRLWMAALLPELSCSVGASRPTQHLTKDGRHLLFTVVCQLPTGVLSHVGQRLSEPWDVKINIRSDKVHVSRHDDEGVYAQASFAVTVVEAFSDSQARFLADEDWEPLDDGESQVVEGSVVVDA